MSTNGVRNGTPVGNEPLCKTCRWGHIIKGFAQSEERTMCQFRAWDNGGRPIPFPIFECSEYDDKRRPSLNSMEKIAWILVTKTAGRQIGFVSAKEFRKIEAEDAEITP